jgi:hypothetical protein
MKVFISWSGELSGDVATLLNEWLPSAVPGTIPWLSKEGIEKGSIWFSAIEEALKETSVGVICLTRENMARPWVLFEAGGLNKGLGKSRVCPLLLDLEDKELDPPLNQFHTTKPNKKDMRALCHAINGQNAEHAYNEQQLDKFFDAFWPKFDSEFTALLNKHGESKPPEKKPMTEMVEQILETVQALLRASQPSPPWAGFAYEPLPGGSRYAGILDNASNKPGGKARRAIAHPLLAHNELTPEEVKILKPILSPGESLVLPGQENAAPESPKV